MILAVQNNGGWHINLANTEFVMGKINGYSGFKITPWGLRTF